MPTPDSTLGEQVAELKLYTVEEVAAMLKLGRTVIFDLMRNGRLGSVREGRARRITPRAIADYIALLERESAEEAA